MIPPRQFLDHFIRPPLQHLAIAEPRLGNTASEQLLLGTALVESGLEAREQDSGPALSFFQIEPATFRDVYNRYLPKRPELLDVVQDLRIPAFTTSEQLTSNPVFVCAIARIKYWMVPELLPAAGDFEALGLYWKRYYNTFEGAGDAAHWTYLYRKYVEGERL